MTRLLCASLCVFLVLGLSATLAQADPPFDRPAAGFPGPSRFQRPPDFHGPHQRVEGVDVRDLARLFTAGPLLLLLCASGLAATALAAAATGHADGLVRTGLSASDRLERGMAVPAVWGVAALVALVIVVVLLFKSQALALLGLCLLVGGLALLGMGVGSVALRLGRTLGEALGQIAPDDLTALRVGLTLLFVAAFLPVIGWVFVGLAGAAGLGAVLETLLTRHAA